MTRTSAITRPYLFDHNLGARVRGSPLHWNRKELLAIEIDDRYVGLMYRVLKQLH
ncbi:hypothetical protein K440DRAFT_627380 [Wilcoxina mikolae CBS 423.85]|nr:hypothetical protein K440DRAFT_627380 [Wilcoxina mikolae CBS 423.85]